MKSRVCSQQDTYWAQNPFRLLPRHDDLDAADVARQHVGGACMDAVVYGGSHAQSLSTSRGPVFRTWPFDILRAM